MSPPNWLATAGLSAVLGSFGIVYLTNRFFTQTPTTPSKTDHDEPIHSLTRKEMVDTVFPFTFVSGQDGSMVKMNQTQWKQLWKNMNKRSYCQEVVYEHQMIHRISRLMKMRNGMTGRNGMDHTDHTDHTDQTDQTDQTDLTDTHPHTQTRPLPSDHLIACLTLITHTLMMLPESSELILQLFRLDDFHVYLQRKDLYADQESIILEYQGVLDGHLIPVESFKYSKDVVWLAYTILLLLFGQMLHQSTISSTMKQPSEPLSERYVKLLNVHDSMLKKVSIPSNEKIFIQSNNNVLLSEHGIEQFELFLNHTKLLACTDDVSLIELALKGIGEMMVKASNPTKNYLIHCGSLDLTNVLCRLILCNSPTVLIQVGRILFSLFVMNATFLDHFIRVKVKKQSIFNEILDCAVKTSNPIQIQIQYMNILYLILLRYENITLLLFDMQSLKFLNLLTEGMNMEFVDLKFVYLQLVYGVCHHPKTHKILLEKNSKATNEFLKQLKRNSFSQDPILRYYAFLIWKEFVCSPQEAICHFVCQEGQGLNVIMFALKKERELSLKKLLVGILNEIAVRKNNNHERMLLLEHFNLMYELCIIFRLSVKYCKQYVKIHSRESRLDKFFQQSMLLIKDIYFLMITFIQYHKTVKQDLIDRYGMEVYFKSFLSILQQLKSFSEVYDSVTVSMKHLFNITDVYGAEGDLR